MALVKDIPALALLGSHAALARHDGARRLTRSEAAAVLAAPQPILLCHAPFTARLAAAKKLTAPIFDVMELFAFTHPAASCVPTPSGLARFLHLPAPQDEKAAAFFIRQAAEILLQRLTQTTDEDAAPIAEMMRQGGWRWGEMVCRALPRNPSGQRSSEMLFSLLSRHLPQWQPGPPPKPAAQKNPQAATGIDPEQAALMLKTGLGAQAEPRAGQMDYMLGVMRMFAPRRMMSTPPVILAQADTGVGKTLGYLVPALLAAEARKEPVWVATYTRALQSQIDRESARLVPDQKTHAKKIAIRKGRENYLCLLNFEESLRHYKFNNKESNNISHNVLAGLVARWLMRTRDGDIKSGDFPSWLVSDRQEAGWLASLTDRRQTCIHSACPHYRRCFIEHQRVAASRADIIIANHALILSHSLFQNPSPAGTPPYYIFDEGHHIFSAADSAFSFRLTGIYMAELRHWLMGSGAASARLWAEGGLAVRMESILREHHHIKILLDDVCAAAVFLPRSGWRDRIARGHAAGIAEEFLVEIRAMILHRSGMRTGSVADGYSLEAEMAALTTASALKKALEALRQKMEFFAQALADLDEDQAVATTSIQRVLTRWVVHDLPVWVAMASRASQAGGLVQWIDRLVIERDEGREMDVGMCRHALDPARAFAEHILAKSSGTLITSASLFVRRRDKKNEKDKKNMDQENINRQNAEQRTGAHHLPYPPHHIYAASSFDYARQARIFIVTDIGRDHAKAARAMALLFSASRGGGLGLWTAVSRLKSAHGEIARRMRRSGRLLLAQHIDPMAVSVLMDIFREDESSCLLGTDALRDGIDVPGKSLRLIAFDRVPWPRPDILHRARREFFGRRHYDDMMASLRLQQAFGRLVRRDSDRGVFVLLDGGFPSRLESVFPAGIEIARQPLAQVLRAVRVFF